MSILDSVVKYVTGVVKAQVQDDAGTGVTSTTLDGKVGLDVYQIKRETYRASAIFAAAANPTDVFTITGSASKTVKIHKIIFTATKTANGFGNVSLIRRSTANSGGTSTTPTIVPLDSTNAAGTAVVQAYTANPTLGTTVGNVEQIRYFYSGLSVLGQTHVFDFLSQNSQECTLRGTAQVLSINLNGVTQTGNSIACTVEWSEE